MAHMGPETPPNTIDGAMRYTKEARKWHVF